MALSVNHLIGILPLSEHDIRKILDTARQFREVLQRPIKKVPSLRDVTVANLFFENSTRTRISFELAEKRLSADVINFSGSGSSLAKGETMLDTVNNILAMKVDIIVVRHPHVGAASFLASRLSRYPLSAHAKVINAGDGTHEHPTQALLDAYSLEEKFGTLKDLKVAIVGDILHSRVALSNIFLLTKMGAHVLVCGPPSLIPRGIEQLQVSVSHNLLETLEWCDAANILRIQLERQGAGYFPSLREYARYFGVNKKILDKLSKPIIIMHPGPINRGVEITTDCADSHHSIILDQVLNGVAVRMAVLYLIAGKSEKISE